MNPTEPIRQRIDRATALLRERLAEDLPLERVAAAADYSPFHFHRLFRGLTGETVAGYVRRLRMERAAERLRDGQDDILALALDLGYGSHEAFSRAFKAQYGSSPSDYRGAPSGEESRADEPTTPSPDGIRILRQPALRLACVRHVGPYDQVGAAWQTLMRWGWARKLFARAESIGLSWDDPDCTPPDDLRYDACIVVSKRARPKPPITIRELPAGTYAVALHRGPYERIGDSYAALVGRIAQEPMQGRMWQLAEPPSLERYRNDPRKTAPEDLLTEIAYPIEEGS